MLEPHPLATAFPAMDAASLVQLRDDIERNGVREPIWLYEGRILDGRHRYACCTELGIQCPTRNYEGGNPFAFVVSLNLRRRHLDESQRAMVAAELARLAARGRPEKNQQNCRFTQSEAAAALNVSTRQVGNAAAVMKHAPVKVVEAVKAGEISVSRAAAEVQAIRRRGADESKARLQAQVTKSAQVRDELQTAKANRQAAQRKPDAVQLWRDVYWAFLHALKALDAARTHLCPSDQLTELSLQAREINEAIQDAERKRDERHAHQNVA